MSYCHHYCLLVYLCIFFQVHQTNATSESLVSEPQYMDSCSSLKTKLVSWPLIWIYMVIWIALFQLLGFYLDVSSEFKTPQPYIKSLNISINLPNMNLTVVKSREKGNNSPKSILYFTPFFEMKDFGFGFGQLPFIEKGCPVTNCFATNNKTLFSKYYLVLNSLKNLSCFLISILTGILFIDFFFQIHLMNLMPFYFILEIL